MQSKDKNLFHNTHSSGFTLIEILVAIAIMVLLATVSIQGFRAYSLRESFRANLNDAVIHIHTARERAQSGADSQSWGIHIGTSSLTYFPGQLYTVGATQNNVLTFPSSYNVTTNPDVVDTVIFSRRAGIPDNVVDIILFDARSSAYATISVSQSGIIE